VFCYLALISVVPLVVLSILSYQVSSSSLHNEVSANNRQIIQEKKQTVELIMEEVESLMGNVAGVPEINDVLQTKKPKTDSYTKLSTQAKMGYILSGYINLKGLVSIDIFSLSGEHYYVGDTLNAQDIHNEIRDYLFDRAVKADDQIFWTGIEDNVNRNSSYTKVITAVKLLKATDKKTLTAKPIGLLVVNYSVDALYDILMKNPRKARYYILIDNQSRIIFHPDKQMIGAEVNPRVLERVSQYRENTSFVEKINGQEMVAIYNRVAKSDWRILSLVQKTEVQAGLAGIRQYTIMALTAGLTLAFLFSWLISYQIVKPIRQITDLFQRIKLGKIDPFIRIKVNSHNEIGELVQWFNAFLQNLEEKRRAEEEIIRLNEALEQRVIERTAALEESHQKLGKAYHDLKNTQSQMLQQEKMATIGQLAAGVAHEINNPMGFISSNLNSLDKYVDKLNDYMSSQSDLLAHVEKMEILTALNDKRKSLKIDFITGDIKDLIEESLEGTERVKKIVQNLKSFSRLDQMDHKPANLNECIESTINIVWNELKYKTTITKEYSDIPMVICYPQQLNQVFMNLLVNAAQAIEIQGVITIRTWSENGFVFASVTDTGSGIKTESLSHIFEPFFTTKESGKGTGLGLSITYDIIKKHGGDITVETSLGEGTTFTISIPLQDRSEMEVV
jgi:signal transduction histidine kinase